MTGNVPAHTELTLGRDRQTRKQFRTLTGAANTRGAKAWMRWAGQSVGGLTADGLGLVLKGFSSVTVYKISALIYYSLWGEF